MSTNNLLAEFEKPTYEQWKVEAEKLLKGVPFEKKMLTKTHEGITLRGIYNPADVEGLDLDLPGSGSFTRSRSAGGYADGGWKVSQELPYSLPEEFNAAVKHDLLRGLNEVTLLLDLAGARGADPDQAKVGEVGGCGTSIATVSDLAAAFKGVHLDAVPVYLKAGVSALPLTALFLAYLQKNGVDPLKVSGCVENDLLNTLLAGDPLPVSLEQSYDELALLINSAGKKLPSVQFIGVQTLAVANAGANAVQELGYALAAGASYLAALTKRGVDATDVARRIRFSLSVSGNFFMEIAKLRAFRQVWSRVLEAYGVSPSAAPAYIHARTAIWNKTRVDANTNMLRVSTEAFSAALGGVQSLHVGPFDEAYQVPDEFSRRVARNAQIVIQEETEITRVIDPAGGSWYVEWLTNEVAQKAWAFFQDIEKQGGIVASLTAGWVQEQVAAVAKNKVAALEKRSETMVGVNNFPNPKEKLPAPKLPDYAAAHAKRVKAIKEYRTGGEIAADTVILSELDKLTTADGDAKLTAAVAAAQQGATLGEITRALRAKDAAADKLTVTPLRITRASLGYEKLREACERAAADGQPAIVFQANIGPSRAYRVRADWTTAYFNVGGLTVKADKDFNTIEEAAEAVKLSGAKVVIICTTDDKYLEVAEPLAKLLKSADSQLFVLLAGAPGDNEAKWRAAGVDDFVHVRTNNFAMLKQVVTKIGAKL